MLETLLLLALATFVFLIPGASVALGWRPKQDDDESGPLPHVALGLGWGFGLVPFIAFSWSLFTRQALNVWVVLGASVLVTAAGGLRWWLGGRQVPAQLTSGWRRAWPVLLAASGIGLLYALKYDRSVFFSESCINRVAFQIMHVGSEQVDVLTSNADDQRLGNTAVVSAFLALFRAVGTRLLHGALAFFIALGGYLLGRKLGGKESLGWVTLAILPLNAYVGGFPYVDENLLVLGFSSLLLPLALRKEVPWASVGALFGLVLMMRHVMLLSIVAMAWLLWTYPGSRRRAFAWAFGAFNLVTVVGHIHHAMALGSVFRLENETQARKITHRLIGEYPGLLQWPFSDEVVRTPWNAFPTFLMWPVYLVDLLGLVLFAAAIVGTVSLLRRRRREGLFWLAWFVPTYLGLSPQENWDVPNKMGILLVVFVPIGVWATEGLRAAFGSPKRWGVALVGVAVLSWLSVLGLRHVEVQADARYYTLRILGGRLEDEVQVRLDRERLTSVAPWPDYSRLSDPARFLRAAKLVNLVDELRNPAVEQATLPYGWHIGEKVDPMGEPVVIEINLSKRPIEQAKGLITRGTLENESLTEIDLSVPGPPVVLTGLPSPVGTGKSLSVLLTPGRADVTGLLLVHEQWPGNDPIAQEIEEEHGRAASKILGLNPEAWRTGAGRREIQVTGSRFRLKVLPGPLTLSESVSISGQRYLVWHAHPEANGPVNARGPYTFFHN